MDDWAIRRGRTYATIVVDLERHRVIDVLPDRTSTSLAAWLREHPGTLVISRDRSTEYAKGAREGAPEAMQVADRWPLLQSARQMLERYLPGVHARLKRLPELPVPDLPVWQRTKAFPRSDADHAPGRANREQRLAVYQTVRNLHLQGRPLARIARELQLSRNAVRSYAHAEEFPERASREVARSNLDPYLPYLHERWEDGCENAALLWREIKAQGYQDGYKQVNRWLYDRRRELSPFTSSKTRPKPIMPAATSTPAARVLPGAKRLAWQLSHTLEELNTGEQAVVKRVRQDPDVALVQDAILAFISMVKNKTSTHFDTWLASCSQSSIKALQMFARGIQVDYDAVKAALDTPWSNAQCEGQVTRTKYLKRQMYGRANFDLLRKRVLLAN